MVLPAGGREAECGYGGDVRAIHVHEVSLGKAPQTDRLVLGAGREGRSVRAEAAAKHTWFEKRVYTIY